MGTAAEKWKPTRYSKYSRDSSDLRERKKKSQCNEYVYTITCFGTSPNVYGMTFTIAGKHLQKSIMASNSIESTEASQH